MTSDEKTQRGERGLTMVELLVCLGVLALALGSILSVFIAGTRFAVRAQRKMDAGRVARGVHERFAKGWEEPPGTWHGRRDDGTVVDETVTSQQMPGISDVQPGNAPAYVIDSPLSLVWRCEIVTPNPYTLGLPDMHMLVIVVSHDTNDNELFDDVADKVVGKYYALLADRSP